MTEKITNENIIRSTSYDQHEVLNWILKLYVPSGQFDLDPTYSKGNFYKKGVPEPRIKMDLSPQTDDTIQGDVTDLQVESESLDSIIFDPPFLAAQPKDKDATKWKEGENVTIGRFGYVRGGVPVLWKLYRRAICELYRVLVNGGVLVFKCQDSIDSGRQYLSHVTISNMAYSAGFYPKDMFILLAKNRIISGAWKNQAHARKFHSYFFVFIKQKCPVKYPGIKKGTLCLTEMK